MNKLEKFYATVSGNRCPQCGKLIAKRNVKALKEVPVCSRRCAAQFEEQMVTQRMMRDLFGRHA